MGELVGWLVGGWVARRHTELELSQQHWRYWHPNLPGRLGLGGPFSSTVTPAYIQVGAHLPDHGQYYNHGAAAIQNGPYLS
jgi:hypothetical protein